MKLPLANSDTLSEIGAVFAIAGVFAAYLILVPPTGEFPSGDDFDLAASAWHLVETGHLRLSDWPEMTLVGHLLWGGLFTTVGGPSFFVLRLSMFAMSAITALALYGWCRKCGHPRSLAIWFAVTFAVNPIIVNLEYTFLNDLSGLAASSLLLLLAPRLDNPARWPLIAYSVLGGIAYCTRETAAIPFIVYCGLALLHALRTRRFGSLFWLLAPFALMSASYQLWLHLLHGVPSFRKLPNLTVGSITHHIQRVLFVGGHLSLLLLPVSVLLITRKKLLRDRKAWVVSANLVAVAIVTSLSLLGRLQAPYIGQFFDLGMRMPEMPVTNLPQSLRGPRWHLDWFSISWFRLIVTGLSLASAVVIGTWLLALWRKVRTAHEPVAWPLIFAGLTSLATLLLYAFTYSYFERYTPTVLLPVMMLVAASIPTRPPLGRAAPSCAWLTTALIGLCSLVGIQDGMQRSRAFWSAVDEVHQLDIEPEHIDAGLAYAGFYRFNPHYRGEDNAGPFLSQLSPVEHDRVLAAMSPESITGNRFICLSFKRTPGHDVVATRTYESWFRSGELFVQLREDVDRTQLSTTIQQWLAENE